MKHFFQKSLLKIFSIILFFAGAAYAQETLIVEPGFNTLDEAITNNPGKTLLLRRGGIYVQDKITQITLPTTILGETEPADEPPAAIVAFELAGQPIMGPFFETVADLTLRNLAFSGWVIGDLRHLGFIVRLLDANITFTFDNNVVNHLYVLYNHPGPNHLTFNITNNIFWSGWNVPRWGDGYFGYWAGDSLEYNFNNNTIIGYGRALDHLGSGPHSIQNYKHNTFAGIARNDIFWDRYDADFIVQNNIFYNISNAGYVGDLPADSIDGTMDFHPLGPDGDNVGIDDYTRDIQINNNLRYSNDDLFAHQAQMNALYIPFLSNKVMDNFNKYGWRFENNMLETVVNGVRTDGIDPQFVNVDSLSRVMEIEYFWDLCVRDSTYIPAFEAKYGSYPAKSPSWLPINPKTGKKYNLSDIIWPIPFDLTPKNPAIQTAGEDGYPLGDLNWYGPEVVAAWEAGLPNPLVSVEGEVNVPNKFELEQNYPNPFNPTTTINYSLSKKSDVQIKVYDVLGNEIATLVNKNQSPGKYSIDFNASNLASGVYIYKMKAGDFNSVSKMILLK